MRRMKFRGIRRLRGSLQPDDYGSRLVAAGITLLTLIGLYTVAVATAEAVTR
jgi:hypothetical protein